LPEDSVPWETMVRFLPILRRFNPALVVSHEEFTAVPAAKAMGLPVVFLTDWFLSAESLQMQALKYADEIVFLDEAGYQDVPGYLSQKVVFTGPVLRRFPNKLPTKTQCRECLRIPERASLVVVVPGSALFHGEALAPIVDVVLEAFDAMHAVDKRLVWVAGEGDHGRLAAKTDGRRDIQLVRPHESILTTMGAADVVVTKGNRITVLEAEALGVASISISFGHNPLDDNRVARVATNTALRARGLTGPVLAHHMRKAIDKTCTLNAASPDTLAMTAAFVAKRLHDHLIRRHEADEFR
jgi:UDP-N-acetylglucosamine:LPS N-acetylglucosamine transferase